MSQKQLEQEYSLSDKQIHIMVAINIIVIIAITIILWNTKYNTNNSIYLYKSEKRIIVWHENYHGDSRINFFNDSNCKVLGVSYGLNTPEKYCLDRSRMVYENSYLNKEGIKEHWDSEILLLSDEGAQKIVDHAVNYFISLDGTSIAYIVGEISTNSEKFSACFDGDLYLYEIESKKTKKIASNCYGNSVILSPDGKSVAFIQDYRSENDFKSCISINGGAVQTVGSCILPFAMANDGKYIYYRDDKGMFVISNNIKCELSDQNRKAYFNHDLSDVLFLKNDETYLCTNGSKIQKFNTDLSFGSLSEFGSSYITLPESVAYSSYNIKTANHSFHTIVFAMDHFTNKVYYDDTEKAYYYIDDNFNKDKICSKNIKKFYLNKEGTQAYYLCDGNLYFANLKNGLVHASLILKDRDISTYLLDPCNNGIYYVDKNQQLMYRDCNGHSNVIGEQILDPSQLIHNSSGEVYFVEKYENIDVLYYSKGGTEKVKINESEHINIYSSDDQVYCRVDKLGEPSGYLLKNGGMLLLEESENVDEILNR